MAADDYSRACLPNNLPDSYDMGLVRPATDDVSTEGV